MPADRKPTMRGRRLGTVLKRYRLAAKLDQEQAAEALGCSTARISRMESGVNPASVADVRYLLELYGEDDPATRAGLEQLARTAKKRGWWMNQPTPVPDKAVEYIALETDATHIRTWQLSLVPGLLQTAEYTRALAGSHPANTSVDAVEQVVAVRQERRKNFLNSGARLAAVLWEPVVTSPMPSAETHRAQLEDLLAVQENPAVTIQVLPLSAWGSARMSAPFVMFSFDGEWAPSAVAHDTHTSSMILEDQLDAAAYAEVFETLRSAAYTPDQSRDVIRHALDHASEETDAE